MLLAQLTDTHVKADRRWAYGRVDTAGCLEAAVAHVNRFAPAVDAVIVTGDLTDRGQPDEFATVREILVQLRAPWFVIPGNHDDRRHFLKAFGDRPYLADCAAFAHYVVEDFPVRLIGLDTTVPGEPFGVLCPNRLAWLERQLARRPETPTLIFQHHPPFETGIGHMDRQSLRNGDAELTLLARFPQVRHVACGHVHRPSETCIRGIGVSIAPNAAHSVTLDLAPDGPPSFTMEPRAIRLFRFADDGVVSSHLSFVGQFDGPHPFFTDQGGLID